MSLRGPMEKTVHGLGVHFGSAYIGAPSPIMVR